MSDSAKSTKRLIEEWQAGGNRDGDFRFLVERYYRPVTHFFRKRGLSADESRDLAQETFLGVYRGMSNFRNDSSFETWLFRIASNTWLSAMRRRSRSKRSAPEVPLHESGLGEGTPVESEAGEGTDEATRFKRPIPSFGDQVQLQEVLDKERVKLLRDALDELPSQMRACVEFRLGQGLKYREIARLLQVSIETVKSQLYQAKARLRRELAVRFSDIEIE